MIAGLRRLMEEKKGKSQGVGGGGQIYWTSERTLELGRDGKSKGANNCTKRLGDSAVVWLATGRVGGNGRGKDMGRDKISFTIDLT